MLKKIPVHQLRMGMHLQKLEGSWIQHPFWKTRFVIDSTSDLQRLKTCGVAEGWIDTALGLDVADVLPAKPRAAVPAAGRGPVSAPAAAALTAPAAPARGPDRPLAAELK